MLAHEHFAPTLSEADVQRLKTYGIFRKIFPKVVVIQNESVKIQRRAARISIFASQGMLLFEQDGELFSEELFRKKQQDDETENCCDILDGGKSLSLGEISDGCCSFSQLVKIEDDDENEKTRSTRMPTRQGVRTR